MRGLVCTADGRGGRRRTRPAAPGAGALLLAVAVLLVPAGPAAADVIRVNAGGDLQAALDAARPGDTILLDAGATFTGNFVLPDKGPSSQYITIRSSAADSVLPPAGVRMTPAYEAYLPKIQSPNTQSALRTAARTNHWRLLFLEFRANQNGHGDIMRLGDGSNAQDSHDKVPYALVLDRLLIRGHPLLGQRRGIALNARDVAIRNSHIADCKTVGSDSQAIGGWNGPGNYVIENNYLEGAAENFMLGGSDPAIPDLVTSDVVFRYNHLSKPLSWRAPILPAPTGVAAKALSGGSLPAGTYAYRVTARRPAGSGATATSAGSVEVAATVADGGAVRVTWAAVPDAAGYRVHGRAAGAQNMFWTVAGTEFTDTGATGSSGSVPNSGTRWTVKNLFELKNARRVTVEYNVMEHNWLAAQTGYAVLLKSVNQSGKCTWCVVEDVTFRYNIVRHTAAALNVRGYHNTYPSGRARNIVFRHNLFYGVDRSTWGGSGWFLQIGVEPENVVVDHNTVDHNGTTVVSAYGRSGGEPLPIRGFEFTNNLMRHGLYGIKGDGVGVGQDTLDAYFPDAVFTANLLAGGPASRYPAGNYFDVDFEGQFVDAAGEDYHLDAGSRFRNAGTDGMDLGADLSVLLPHAALALSGGGAAAPIEILTRDLPTGAVGVAYDAQLLAVGGTGSYAWSLVAGALPAGLSLSSDGRIAGTPAAAETAAFRVAAADSAGGRAEADLAIAVSVSPVSILTTALADGVAQMSYSQTLLAEGGSGAYEWSLAAGALPDGLTLDPAAGVISGTPSASGSWLFTVKAADREWPDNWAQRDLTIAVTAAASETETETETETPDHPWREVVLYAAEAPVVAGGWRQEADATAAGGALLVHPDARAKTVDTPLAAPEHYFELTFDATAGIPYRIWLRGRAERDHRSNDSVFVQFSGSGTATGTPIFRIGTTSGSPIELQDCPKCKLSGWGWQDNGVGGLGPEIYFATSGPQTLRIQTREDGMSIDQIVLSPARYLTEAPGARTDDDTILPPSGDVSWTAADIGSVGVAGGATQADGAFVVDGSGADVWGVADAFKYVYRPLNGDGEILARVASLEYPHHWAKAGVMMRESLDPGSRHAFMLVSAERGLAFQRRTATGGTSTHTGGGNGTAAQWVRLVRRGSTFEAYRSADGAAWSLVGRETIEMAASIHVGLALTSHDDQVLARAVFDRVSLSDAGTWAAGDIGSVGLEGTATESDGTFAVSGAGKDIWGTADAFHYVYRPLHGDGEIIARVVSLDYTHHWAKAGVMMRESLDPGSRHAFMLVSADRGLAFQRRTGAGGKSTHTDGGGGAAPHWVRLVRRGSTFEAYRSADGASWALVGSETIEMDAAILVGLAVTSHHNAALAQAVFDDVR